LYDDPQDERLVSLLVLVDDENMFEVLSHYDDDGNDEDDGNDDD
jgi:hypothetical protein